jgi:hypothetical protein
LVNDLQNGYKSYMKFLFHANYTPLFIFYKGMWTCNLLQSGFCFPISCIYNIYCPFTGNPKLFMISTWLIKISWPHSCPWILPSSVSSQVCKKSCNESFHGAIHCKLDKFSKPTRLAHLNSFEFIFIHCSIFYISFALDVFFLTCFFNLFFYMCSAFSLHHGFGFWSWVLGNNVANKFFSTST